MALADVSDCPRTMKLFATYGDDLLFINTNVTDASQGRSMMRKAEIGRCVGLSKKQLERKFPRAVGTTPKTFARLSRFLNICHHIDTHRGTKLTQLTYECGYFDQAHFIKELKAFSGFTPKKFFERKNVVFADL